MGRKKTRYKVSDIVRMIIKDGGAEVLYHRSEIKNDMSFQDALKLTVTLGIVPRGWNTPLTSIDDVSMQIYSCKKYVNVDIELRKPIL